MILEATKKCIQVVVVLLPSLVAGGRKRERGEGERRGERGDGRGERGKGGEGERV